MSYPQYLKCTSGAEFYKLVSQHDIVIVMQLRNCTWVARSNNPITIEGKIKYSKPIAQKDFDEVFNAAIKNITSHCLKEPFGFVENKVHY